MMKYSDEKRMEKRNAQQNSEWKGAAICMYIVHVPVYSVHTDIDILTEQDEQQKDEEQNEK